ncbi:hypothetical protein D3C76_1499090 [compost metagenome]
MPANGVIVRVIANMLNHMQCRRIRRQTESLTFGLKEQRFQTGFAIGSFGDTEQ